MTIYDQGSSRTFTPALSLVPVTIMANPGNTATATTAVGSANVNVAARSPARA